jgi:hypothetical protein
MFRVRIPHQVAGFVVGKNISFSEYCTINAPHINLLLANSCLGCQSPELKFLIVQLKTVHFMDACHLTN